MTNTYKKTRSKKLYSLLLFQAVFVFSVSMYSLPALATVPTPAPADATKTPTYTSQTLPFDPHSGDSSQQTSTSIDLGQNDPLTVALRIINAVLTFLGIAFLIILIYAGVLWTVARGNQEEIEKAKKLLIQGVIGFVIIVSSLGIARLVFFLVEGYNQGKNTEDSLQYL